MSSLIHLPEGATLDYWWQRMEGRSFRKRFLLTKALEVMVYYHSRGAKESSSNPACSIMDMEPNCLLNNVKIGCLPFVVIPSKCSCPEHISMLRRAVEALLSQNIEIIIIDDGSSTPIQLQHPLRIIRLNECKGPANARNIGMRAALQEGADLVFFTDSDCIPCSDWIDAAIRRFTSNPYAHAFSGKTTSYGRTWFDRYHEINGTLNGRRFKDTAFLLYGPTCNLVISRVVAEMISFDPEFPNAACEDIDFCIRAIEAGFRIFHAEDMLVQHDYGYRSGHFIANLIRFVRQFKKYAKAEPMLLKRCPKYYPLFGQTEEIPAT